MRRSLAEKLVEEIGLFLLQEYNELSNQQALDAFGFDTRWRYALDAVDEHAYLSRRSLVEFRRRLAAQDPEMMLVRGIFEKISHRAIKKKSKGETLQSAFDPDASYGHKGSGYSVHVTETCNNANKKEIITEYEVHGTAPSDMGKLRVRRATRVCFAVACKVIARNIKRWGKALATSGPAFQRLICSILRRVGVFEINPDKTCFGTLMNGTEQL